MRTAITIRNIAVCLAALILPATLLMGEELPGALDVPPVPVRAVAFSPSGNLLAIAYGLRDGAGGLLVWNLEKQEPLRVTRLERGFTSVSFSPDGALLAFSQRDSAPVIIEMAGGGEVASLDATHRGPVAFSPDGQTLATGGQDKTIRLWDLKTRADRKVFSGPTDFIYGKMVFSPKGDRLAAACASEGIYVWDLTEDKPRFNLRHGSYFTRSALFLPDNRWIVTGGWDGTTRIWDTTSGELQARLGGAGGVDSLDYEPTQKILAISAGKSIQLHKFVFDSPTETEGKQIAGLLSRFEDDRYDIREAASAELVKLGFAAHAELRKAAAESPSAEVRIRARRVRQAILASSGDVLTGHQNNVWCLCFSKDGKSLATGSEDGSVRVWDVAKRVELIRLVPAAVEKK